MKRIQPSVIVTTIFLLCGCSSSQDSDNLQSLNGDELSRISFIMSDMSESGECDDTRAVIRDGANLDFVWAETDSVGIFPEHGDQLSYSMANGAGSKNAVFTGGSWALKSTDTYSSYYPFNRWNYFKTASELELDYTGQEQDGMDNINHLSPYDYQYAAKTKSTNGSLTFAYKHIGFVMKLKLTIPSPGTYESVYLSANENLFVTKANLDLTTETPTLTPLVTAKKHEVKLKNFTTTTANQQVLVYLMCYPINGQGKTFYVKLRSTTGHIFTASISPSANYAAGTNRNITKTMAYETTESISFGGEFDTEDSDL